MTAGVDEHAIGGKFAAPREHARKLVIGGGEAGLTAAIAAARGGETVVLVDENPVPMALMGLDVPLFYGQRFNAAVQEEARMVERLVASSPLVEAAFDAGVDVRLGVTCWGVFTNGPAIGALPGPVAGLSDGASSWMCGFDRLVLAAGARDLVLGFPGADLPGVMGVQGFTSLLTRYDAFAGRRVVVLGSGTLALDAALQAVERGVDVAGLIEVLPEPVGPQGKVARLAALGVHVLCGCAVSAAQGSADGVIALLVRQDGALERIACDTVVMAWGVVPAVELASIAGCALHYDGARGGWVPDLGDDGSTSVAGITCVGDCAGLAEDAQSEAYRLAWMRSLMAAGQDGAMACLCEEVTRGELLGVRPPRYLGCGPGKIDARNSRTLLRDGPFNPDQIKRLTRAGMGPCQGRRCREQVALMLAIESGSAVGSVPLASYRAPVRPLPLQVLADADETVAMGAGWDVWFGIRSQWVPYDQIGTPAEEELLAAGGTSHA